MRKIPDALAPSALGNCAVGGVQRHRRRPAQDVDCATGALKTPEHRGADGHRGHVGVAHAETLSVAAAAVSVVTNEDIRRSGATSHSRSAAAACPACTSHGATANSWAVSSRGFSSINSEKLLVLSDTRSIYTPLFSGVFWDVQDYLLEDIERIEVIRGPGASAVGLERGQWRDQHHDQARARHAGHSTSKRDGRHGEKAMRRPRATAAGSARAGFFRVFGKYFDRDATLPSSGDNATMTGASATPVFAPTGTRATRDALTLQGDVYRANIGQFAPVGQRHRAPGPGGRSRSRASAAATCSGAGGASIDAGSDLQLRVYYDRTHRDDPSFHDDLDTFDVDLQHRYAAAARHEIDVGRELSLHRQPAIVGKGDLRGRTRSTRATMLFSGFAQDQFAICAMRCS